MNVTRDLDAFMAVARACAPDFGPATARAAFLVEPAGLARTACAADNRYTAAATAFEPARAARQHRDLQRALSTVVPTVCFAGDPATPDDLFPNNVFGSVAGRLVVGRMHHGVRRAEAGRRDIRGFFTGLLGYAGHDLSTQGDPCEITGSLVIDRRRGIGFCGLSDRCSEAGARLMHAAFGLRATLAFDLAEGEYHANVVLAVLAGRAALVCADGFADPAVASGIAALYAPHAALLSPAERAAFAGNAIALSGDVAWMSATAGRALAPENRAVIEGAGFRLACVELDAVEAAGGSLRCCVAEIF